MSTKPLIKESLFLFKVVGIDLYRSNNWKKSIAVFTIISQILGWINICLECIFHWQGLNSTETLAICFALYLMFTKVFTILLHRKKMLSLLHKMQQFWPINKYDLPLQNDITAIYDLVRKSFKFMCILTSTGVILFIVIAILGTSRRLPVKTYFPTDLNQSPEYEIMFVLQIWQLVSGSICSLAFDFLFVSLIIHFTCQLKIVRRGFQQVSIIPEVRGDTQRSLFELYTIINHQNLVFLCIKYVKEIYSSLLLNIYFINMICICFGLLSIIGTGFPPTLQNLSRYGMYVTFCVTQMFFYCATGNYLITESENVAVDVYHTDWWTKTQPKFRKAVVLIIQRANKAEKLTAGGMFALNLGSFRKVIRSALSFCTFIHAVYK